MPETTIKVWIEQGVIWDLHPIANEGFRRIVAKAKQDVFVTSGREGDHLAHSFHYSGFAWDMRSCGLNAQEMEKILNEVSKTQEMEKILNEMSKTQEMEKILKEVFKTQEMEKILKEVSKSNWTIIYYPAWNGYHIQYKPEFR